MFFSLFKWLIVVPQDITIYHKKEEFSRKNDSKIVNYKAFNVLRRTHKSKKIKGGSKQNEKT